MRPKPAESHQIQVPENEACQILHLSARTLYNRRKHGEISYVEDGGRIFYRLDELDRYSRSKQVMATK